MPPSASHLLLSSSTGFCSRRTIAGHVPLAGAGRFSKTVCTVRLHRTRPFRSARFCYLAGSWSTSNNQPGPERLGTQGLAAPTQETNWICLNRRSLFSLEESSNWSLELGGTLSTYPTQTEPIVVPPHTRPKAWSPSSLQATGVRRCRVSSSRCRIQALPVPDHPSSICPLDQASTRGSGRCWREPSPTRPCSRAVADYERTRPRLKARMGPPFALDKRSPSRRSAGAGPRRRAPRGPRREAGSSGAGSSGPSPARRPARHPPRRRAGGRCGRSASSSRLDRRSAPAAWRTVAHLGPGTEEHEFFVPIREGIDESECDARVPFDGPSASGCSVFERLRHGRSEMPPIPPLPGTDRSVTSYSSPTGLGASLSESARMRAWTSLRRMLPIGRSPSRG